MSPNNGRTEPFLDPESLHRLPFEAAELDFRTIDQVAHHNLLASAEHLKGQVGDKDIEAARKRLEESLAAATAAADAYKQMLESKSAYYHGATAFIQRQPDAGRHWFARSQEAMLNARNHVQQFAKKISNSPFLESTLTKLDQADANLSQQFTKANDFAQSKASLFLAGVSRLADRLGQMAEVIKQTPGRIASQMAAKACDVRDAALQVVSEAVGSAAELGMTAKARAVEMGKDVQQKAENIAAVGEAVLLTSGDIALNAKSAVTPVIAQGVALGRKLFAQVTSDFKQNLETVRAAKESEDDTPSSPRPR